MPNNLDMGGFGSPGLPVRSNLSGNVRVDSTSGGPLTTTYPVQVYVDGTRVFSVNTYGGMYTSSRSIGGSYTDHVLESGNGIIKLAGYINVYGGGSITSTITHSFDYTSKLALTSAGYYAWSSTTSATGAPDVTLYRDAANTLAQRNGTNAQTSRIYGTYTDSSNYRRFTHSWNTTTGLLMVEGAGTGTDGSVAFNDAALATNATVGFVMIPSCAGTPSGTPADIPTGQIPMVWDSTNLKLYVYTGGAWKASAAFT